MSLGNWPRAIVKPSGRALASDVMSNGSSLAENSRSVRLGCDDMLIAETNSSLC